MTTGSNQQLSIALAQLNPTVGDVAGNLAKVRKARDEARALGADLVLFGELVLSGYPPEDLVLKPAFQQALREAVEALAAESAQGPALLVTTPWVDGGKLYNAAVLVDGGKIAATRYKHDLPNYGVFDEKRVFAAGPLPGPVPFRGARLGVMICEDMWTPDVAECLQETGAEILLVPNGSPFETEKYDVRLNLAIARVVETGLPLVYVNQVGGQDELVFDGATFAIGADKQLAAQLPAFVEQVRLSRWQKLPDGVWQCYEAPKEKVVEGLDAIYQAMVLGLRDYVNKNRFPGVVLGLSGGIDSALSAAVAADALGPERVWCVMLPSKFTSKESLDEAAGCAKLLGVKLDTIPIEPAVGAFLEMLAPTFAGKKPDITEENMQARARGITLMALSNKFGHMVLTTGNKSEMSVGYATLYGDMCGGYSVLKDVYKMAVYALARWRNQHMPPGALGKPGRVIPELTITRAPTAELRENQKDQDSLPPYPVLDDILEGLVEREMSVEQIAHKGHDIATVKRIEHLLYVAEYKRRQAPPGVKITRKQFGRDRRYPITNGFRDRK
jgi:NAD+ synthase